jgi:hypothetical protein
MYTDAVETSTNAVGTLQKQQDIYMESTDAKLQKLKTTWQDLYGSLIDEDELNTGIDALSNLVQVFDNFIDSFGGGTKSIIAFGTVIANIFNKQISKAIILANSNAQKYAQNVATAEKQLELISAKIADVNKAQTTTGKGTITANDIAIQKEYEVELNYAKQLQAARKGITQEQYSELVKMQQKRGQLEYETVLLQKQAAAEVEKATGIEKNNLEENEYLNKLNIIFGTLQSETEEATEFARKKLDETKEQLDADKEELILKQKQTKELEVQTNEIIKQAKASTKNTKSEGNNIDQSVIDSKQNFLDEVKKYVNNFDIPNEELLLFIEDFQELLNKQDKSKKDWEEIEDDQQKIVNIVQQELIVHNKNIELLKEHVELSSDNVNKANQEWKNQKKAAAEMEKKVEAVEKYKKAVEEIQSKQNSSANIDNQFSGAIENAKQNKDIAQRVQTATAAISSLTMVWSSVSSVVQTIEDDTADTVDKIEQVVMSLGMSLPMVISNMKQLGDTLNITNLGIKSNIQLKKASKAVEEASLAIQDKETSIALTQQAIDTKNITIEKIKKELKLQANLTDKETIAILSSKSKEELISIGLTEEQAIAITGQAAAEEVLLKATEEETAAQEVWNASLLANPVLDVVVALVALAAILYGVAKASEKAAEAQAEFQEEVYTKTKEVSDSTNEEAENLTQLYQSYIEMTAALDDTQESKDNLKSATEELCTALGIEWDALDKIQGKYEDVDAAILQAQKDSLQTAINNNQDTLDDSQNVLFNKVNIASKNSLSNDNGLLTYKIKTGLSLGDNDQEVLELAASWLMENYKDKLDFSSFDTEQEFISHTGGTSEDYDTYLEEILQGGVIQFGSDISTDEAVSILQELYNYIIAQEYDGNLGSAESYKQFTAIFGDTGVTDTLTEVKETRSEMEDQILQLAGLKIQSQYDISQITTTQELQEYRDAYIAQLKSDLEAAGYDVSSYTSSYFDDLADEFLSGFNNLSDTSEDQSIIDAFTSRFWNEDWSSTREMSYKDLQDFLQKVEEEGGLDLLATIDLDEVSSLEAIKNTYENLKNNLDLENITANITTIITAQSEINSDEGLTEDTRTSLEDTFGDLIDWDAFDASTPLEQITMLNELLAENNKELLENYDAQANVQEAEEERLAKVSELKEEYESLKAELEHLKEADNYGYIPTESFDYIEDRMAEIKKELEDEITIDINIDQTTIDVFSNAIDQILSGATQIQSVAEMIGEGFLVAAEDASVLAATYPSILDNAEVLADGQIQLNSDVVAAILNGNADVIEGDTEKTAELLRSQIALLDADMVYQQSIIDNLQAYVEGSQNASETNKKIAAAEATYKTTVSENATNEEIDAINTVMEANVEFTNDVLTNLDAVGTRISKVSSIMKRFINGEEVDYQVLGGTAVGGNASYYTSNFDANSYKNLSDTNKQAVLEQIDSAVAQLEADEKTRALLTAELSSLLSGSNSATDAAKNAAAGLGGTYEEEDPEVLDYLEDEADRYHDINLEIEKLSTNLERLQNQQDKLYGQDLIDNLNEQLDILQQQNAAYKTKIALAKQEASEIKSSLASAGVTFTDDGYIANYASVVQTKLNYVNSLIEQYNAMSASEQEEFADTVDAAKEDYEDFVEQIENYDTLISETIPDLEDDIQEVVDKEIEINISKFTMEIEIRLDMAEAEREYNEFKQKIIDDIADDDYVGLANYKLKDMNSYYNSEGTAAIQKLTEQVNNTLAELTQMDKTGWSDIYGDDRSQALEDLQTYYEKLIESQEDFNDLIDDIQDYYVDTIKKANDAFDDQVDTYEYIGDLLEHDMKVVKLIYGDEAYSKMSTYYDKIETNNNNQLSFLSKEKAYIEQMMAAETNEEVLAEWKEQWESVVSDLNSLVEDSIQNIIDKYTNAINETFDAIADKLTNGMGLDFTETQWDLINDNADSYLDTVNAIYKTQEVKSKFIDAINNTDSVSAQKKLKAVMNEQLDILESQEELTQYDIDRANAMYEIAVKQIALEEAQQNKSSMRLRRDSQGNYTYQYVADEDSISKAQEELAEAQNNLFNLDKDQVQETLDDALSAYKEWQDAITSYTEQAYEDGTYNTQAYWDKLDEINAQYTEKFNRYWENYQEAKTNLEDSTIQSLKSSYDTDNENFVSMILKNETLFTSFIGTSTEEYQNMTDEEKKQAASLALKNEEVWNNISDITKTAITEEIVPQVTSGVATMLESIAGEGGFEQIATEATNNVKDATEDYETSLNNVAASADVDFTAIGNGIDSTVDSTEALLEDNQELLDSYDDEITKIKEVITNMTTLIAKYNSAAAAAQRATTAAYDYITATNEKAATAARNSSSSSSGSSSSSSSSGSSSSSKITSTLKDVASAATETVKALATNSGDKTSDTTTKDKMYVIVSPDQLTYRYYTGNKLYSTRTNRSAKDALSEYNRFKTTNKDKYDFTLVGASYGPGLTSAKITNKSKGQVNSGVTLWGAYQGTTLRYTAGSEDDLRLWAAKYGYYPAFDTGGYTGSWGDDGKLAVLHQKELVLNASDTENMLAAVGIVRDMSSLLSNINSNIQDKLLALAAGLSSSTGSVSATSDTLEQNVHIEASFPNVSSSKEIENAFNNLTNIASQRAFNNKR